MVEHAQSLVDVLGVDVWVSRLPRRGYGRRTTPIGGADRRLVRRAVRAAARRARTEDSPLPPPLPIRPPLPCRLAPSRRRPAAGAADETTVLRLDQPDRGTGEYGRVRPISGPVSGPIRSVIDATGTAPSSRATASPTPSGPGPPLCLSRPWPCRCTAGPTTYGGTACRGCRRPRCATSGRSTSTCGRPRRWPTLRRSGRAALGRPVPARRAGSRCGWPSGTGPATCCASRRPRRPRSNSAEHEQRGAGRAAATGCSRPAARTCCRWPGSATCGSPPGSTSTAPAGSRSGTTSTPAELAIRFEGAEHGVPGLPNEVVHWPEKGQTGRSAVLPGAARRASPEPT